MPDNVLTFTSRKYPPAEDLLMELQDITPDMMDDSLLVELAWDYGIDPEKIRQAYIMMLDGVS